MMYRVHRVHDKTKVQDFLKTSSCLSFHVNIVLFRGKADKNSSSMMIGVKTSSLLYEVRALVNVYKK